MLFVSYRENALFNEYVPQLLEGLPISGTFIIPAETWPEDKGEEYITAFTNLQKNGVRGILCDETCNPMYFENRDGMKSESRFSRGIYWKTISLNWLFQKEVEKWVGNNSVATNLCHFATEAAAGHKIQKIVVVKNSLGDHTLVGSQAPLANQRDTWITSQLAACFNASTAIVNTLAEALPHMDDESTLLVADRHCGIKKLMGGGAGYNSLANWPKKCALLLLPFETCAAQLIGRGTFPHRFDIQSMQDEVRKDMVKF
jgi:hypothetical protein